PRRTNATGVLYPMCSSARPYIFLQQQQHGNTVPRTKLEQTKNLAVVVDIHVVGSWLRGQAWHGHHGPGQSDHEACTGTNIEFANRHTEVFWRAEGFRIISKRVLGFGHTHRDFVLTGVFELFELLL